MVRDIIDDIASILYPLAPRPTNDPHADEWYSDYCQQVTDKREDFSHNLRTAWEVEDDLDPLLSAISEARSRKAAAEEDIRKLIAYGREFVKPRPYRLVDLASASGMSISGTRTAYQHREVATVAENTGATPREWRAPDEEAGGLIPMNGYPRPDASIPECGCHAPWPLLYTIIDDISLYAIPCDNLTPSSAHFDAWCLGCGTQYPSHWRIGSFVALPRDWTRHTRLVPWHELAEANLTNGSAQVGSDPATLENYEVATGPAVTSWIYKVVENRYTCGDELPRE